MAKQDDHLADVLNRMAPAEDEDSLPFACDGKCYNSRSTKPVYTLHCNLGRDGYRSFQYMHLDSDSTFQATKAGHVIVLRFAGIKPVKVVITGRNLWKLYDFIHQHRMQRINVADRDFAEDDEPIVLGIAVEPVEDEKEFHLPRSVG